MGFQPAGSDVTPGAIVLRIQNNTASTITTLYISYDIWVYNDQGRANSLNFAHSSDDNTYSDITSANYTTPEAADGSPAWTKVVRTVEITGLSVTNGSNYYLQWKTDDVSGGGSRDEFGISNIVVYGNQLTRQITGTAGWRMLSFPKTGGTVADISDDTAIQGITGGSDASDANNFIIYTSSTGGAFGEPTNASTAFGDGYGFAVYFYNNTSNGSSTLPLTLDVSGSEPGSDVTVNLYSGATGRFTMVGNPFASNVNLNSVTSSGGIQNNVRFWNNTGSYITQDRTASGGFIAAPWQGFWVETSSATDPSTITIPTSAKTSSSATASYFGKTLSSENEEFDVSFALKSSYNTDESVKMQFRSAATTAWDAWDATQLWPLLSQFVVGGFKGEREGEELFKGVESLPLELDSEVEIPFNVELYGDSQEMELSWQGMDACPEHLEILLYDTITKVSIDMKLAQSYTFYQQGVAAKVKPVNLREPQYVSSSDDSRFKVIVTPVELTSNEPSVGPEQTRLNKAYPNPFNPTTNIQFDLAQSSQVKVSVFDIMGREIATLLENRLSAGTHTVSWDASDFASGIYLVRMQAGAQTFTQKITLTK